MKNSRRLWLAAFTASFALLAAYVFWGTWSLDFVPVMPDCAFTYPNDWFTGFWRGWITNGKFVPGDLKVFLGSPYFWQELQYAIPLYLSGLGLAYLLVGRGLSRPAAYGAGLLLSFCGYWSTLFSAGHLGWFVWMSYGVFAFGLADRAARVGKLRHWLMLGACVAWASYQQSDLWLLFTVFTGAWFLWCCVRERVFPWKGALIAAIAFFVIAAPSIRSAFVNDLAGRDKQISEGQTVSNAEKVDDAEKRWIFVTNWSLPPDETAEFLVPRLHGDTSCPLTLSIGARYGSGVKPYEGAIGRPKDAPAGNYRQHSIYVGWVTCLLALLGLCAVVRRSDARFFAIAAFVFWLFSLGRYCEPVYRLVYALPFGDYLRAPVKWHHLTELCLCVLAGYGLQTLLGLLAKVAALKRYAPCIVGAVVLLGAWDLARVDHLYCAPVDIREARRQNAGMQMTFLRRQDFNNPQVQAMVQNRRIVSLAQPNADTYLVGVINPYGPKSAKPLPPLGLPAYLSILSMIASLGVIVYSVKKS